MKTFFTSSMIGAADQALLSAFNLFIGIAFVSWASKEQYAAYTLTITGLLLLQSIQNALINSPIATLVPSSNIEYSRNAVFASGFVLQCGLTGLIVLTATLCLIFDCFNPRFQISTTTIWSGALAAAGLLMREYLRGNFYLRRNASGALVSDAIYVLIASCSIAAVAPVFGFTAEVVLFCIGLTGLTLSTFGVARTELPMSLLTYVSREGFTEIWRCALWTLPSVGVSWLYSNAFIYIVDHFLGRSAVADLSASRLLLTPLALIVVGWSSAFRPRASELFANNDIPDIQKILRYSVLGFIIVSALYGAFLFSILPVINSKFLGDKYAGLQVLILSWLVFFTVTSIRTIGMSAMLSSRASFKPLFGYGCVALLIAVPGTVAASATGKLHLAVIALIAAELSLALLIWFRGWPKMIAGFQTVRTQE